MHVELCCPQPFRDRLMGSVSRRGFASALASRMRLDAFRRSRKSRFSYPRDVLLYSCYVSRSGASIFAYHVSVFYMLLPSCIFAYIHVLHVSPISRIHVSCVHVSRVLVSRTTYHFRSITYQFRIPYHFRRILRIGTAKAQTP